MDSHCGQRRASKSATEISVRRERSRAMCRQGEGRALREAQLSILMSELREVGADEAVAVARDVVEG